MRPCSSCSSTESGPRSSRTRRRPASSWSAPSAPASCRAATPATSDADSSEQGERELPAGGAHPRVVVTDDGEQLHQVLTGLVAVLPRGAAHDGEHVVEGL